MKIIRMTGDMPPCCCGESGGGGGTDCCACDLLPDSIPVEIVKRGGFGAGCWGDETVMLTKTTNLPPSYGPPDGDEIFWEGTNSCGDKIGMWCNEGSEVQQHDGVYVWTMMFWWCDSINSNTFDMYCDPVAGTIWSQDQTQYQLYGGGINCCCDEVGWFEANINTTCGCSCNTLPSTLHAHTSFCGTSSVVLHEVDPGSGEVRAWEGTGSFGGGPGTARFRVYCTGQEGETMHFCFDTCLDLPPCGVVDEALSCRDLPWEYYGVPMGACDPNCYDSFYITISESSTSPY